MRTWQKLAAPESELSWLSNRDGNGIGYDPTGWEASTWVLHAMYEPTTLTASPPREVPPWWGADDPGAGWQRLLWSEDLRRNGRVLDVEDPDWPSRWLDGGPAWGPDEGTLDRASWSALVDVLSGLSGHDASCKAYLDPLASQDWNEAPTVWTGPLGEITSLVTQIGHRFSPTNWWPDGHSWFVWTDYDSCATKVSGSEQLIRTIEADSTLESTRWTGPAGRGGRSWEEWWRATRPAPPRRLP